MKKNAMQRLNELILEKNSRICAGLDPTWENIPETFKEKIIQNVIEELRAKWVRVSKRVWQTIREEPKEAYLKEILLEYCKEYIQAVKDVVPAIKINSAFFEQHFLKDMYFYIAKEAKASGLFVIGDVKRADIGSTSAAYAEAYLGEDSPFDAITINPYIGTDGVMPFLKLAKKNGKGVFVLVKTSNESSAEIQDLELADGRYVYEAVADLVLEWAEEVDPEGYSSYPMVGAVVGATHPEQAEELAFRMGATFFLVPGYGAQGATADDVASNFDLDGGIGAIVNSSRGIMNAYKNDRWKDRYSEETWEEAAKAEAIRATEEINEAINRYYQTTVVKERDTTGKSDDDASGIREVLCCKDIEGVGDE